VSRELDRAYSPSSVVTDSEEVLRRGAVRAAEVRASGRCELDLAYGPDPSHRLDLFPADHPDGCLLLWVHGGHWQESSKADTSYVARGLVAHGITVAVLGYGLAPQYPLPGMIDAVRRAASWLTTTAGRGYSPAALAIGGSSAGAYLAAAAIVEGTLPDVKLPPASARAAILLSGVYDLRPVVATSVVDALALDAAAAAGLSLSDALPLRADRVVVARGEGETDAYVRQHDDFVAAVRARGGDPVDRTVAGTHHFDLPMQLWSPVSALTALVVAACSAEPLRAGA
jgi:arylformamidase